MPVINGVLTTDSIEQTIERSGTKAGNKGSEAALTTIEMVNLLKGNLKHVANTSGRLCSETQSTSFCCTRDYEWQMSHNPVHEIEARTRVENAMHKVDLNYYHELLTQVVAQHEALDELLIPVLDRELTALDGVELATLRLGAYELRDHLEVPYRVVLDETIELAKHFGGADSHKYINGVLTVFHQSFVKLKNNKQNNRLDVAWLSFQLLSGTLNVHQNLMSV